MGEQQERFNPFPGLWPITEEEDYLFFGREAQSNELRRRLRGTRFLAVVGTSGSGKSSLVRAGLIPALHCGFVTQAGSSWWVALMRPWNNPIGAIAATLNEPDVFGITAEDTADDIPQTLITEPNLRRSISGQVEVVQQARIGKKENLLAIVDQFEKLFRFQEATRDTRSHHGSAAFVKLLLETSRATTIPVYIVLTMRSDFLGDCAQFRDLPQLSMLGNF